MSRPSIAPHVWKPPPAPLRSRRHASDRPLPHVDVITLPGAGPEDIALDRAGRVITGLADGRILRVTVASAAIETIATVPGRPLGVEIFHDGRVLVCSAGAGLLCVDPSTGDVETLATQVDGAPLRVCNNAAIDADGTVWFTNSTTRFDLDDWKADYFEHARTGALLRRTARGDIDVVIGGLAFANGVTIAPDGSVLVVEGGRYRILKVATSGRGHGAYDVVIDNMPAVPDNVTTGSDGLIWVGCVTPRNALLDRLLALPPVIRKAVWALPDRLQPAPAQTVWVMALDSTGRVVHDLQGTHPHLSMVTCAVERQGTLYLGSLTRHAIGVIGEVSPSQ